MVCLIGAVGLVAAACGDDDSDTSATGGSTTQGGGTERTVDIDMVDNAFEPTTLDVEVGETVRFAFTNTGAVVHDAFVGDDAAQAEHEDEMRAAEDEGSAEGHDMGSEDETTTSAMDDDGHGMESGSEEGITVEPGDTGELTYMFDQPGTFEIGCHEPGHYDAGMKVTVTVS